MNAQADESLILDLSKANHKNWAFVGNPWEQDADGLITSPGDKPEDENIAFYTEQAYGDFVAEYDFRWDCVWTTSAFVFRAPDARHYYVLDFPAVGQQYRAEHFWATLAKVDERGFRVELAMKLVPGVTSAARVWHHVKVEVKGNQINAWIDKRPVISLQDSTYAKPGYVGLDTYNAIAGHGEKTSFRNFKISATPVSAVAFAASPGPVQTWRAAHPEASQGCGRIARAGNGDMLTRSGANRLLRSTDNGMTWTADDPLPESHPIGSLVETDGALAMYRNTYPGLPAQILKSESPDHGRTWSDYRQVGEVTLPDDFPYENFGGGPIVQTDDGGLVMFSVCSGGTTDVRKNGRCIIAFEAFDTFAIRSDDGGESWSEPANVDGDPHDDQYMMFTKCGCEVSAVELQDGSMLAMNRPIWSPFIWESRSFDGGRSWTPAMRGPFALYATCNAMVRTASGALLIGGRFPGLAVQLSLDNGYTWQFYQIDTAAWANGAMIEVEPDVVLFIYGGREELRCQTLRVTPDGLQPVR
jgi:hypothetical protein